MEQSQIIKFITGNLEESDAQEVRNWIFAAEENKNEFIRLKNIFAFTSIGKHTLSVNHDFLLINKQITRALIPTNPKNYLFFMKYAAIITFIFLIGFSTSELRGIFASDQSNDVCNEYYAPEGQISEFKLMDGTKVWLNAGTRIKVPVNFSTKNRIIYMEGEAFFEVRKDPENPFFVHTSDLSLRVMGTSFNISAYDSEAISEVTLTEGLVGIKERYGERLAMLRPGQQLAYDKTNRSKIRKEVDVAPYEAWKDGKMIFKGESLKEIATRLERWFDVDIEFADQFCSEVKFTGTILKNKPLNQILDVISLSAPIRYNIKTNSDQKNKVTMYSLK